MRINIPTISGITPINPIIREIVRSIEQIAQGLATFTSNGIIAQDNISYSTLKLTNQESEETWIKLAHDLRRKPIGYLMVEGSPASILDARIGNSRIEVKLAPLASVTIALM
jgi:hypothetical protein